MYQNILIYKNYYNSIELLLQDMKNVSYRILKKEIQSYSLDD